MAKKDKKSKKENKDKKSKKENKDSGKGKGKSNKNKPAMTFSSYGIKENKGGFPTYPAGIYKAKIISAISAKTDKNMISYITQLKLTDKRMKGAKLRDAIYVWNDQTDGLPSNIPLGSLMNRFKHTLDQDEPINVDPPMDKENIHETLGNFLLSIVNGKEMICKTVYVDLTLRKDKQGNLQNQVECYTSEDVYDDFIENFEESEDEDD